MFTMTTAALSTGNPGLKLLTRLDILIGQSVNKIEPEDDLDETHAS